jgi:hypothetical protein
MFGGRLGVPELLLIFIVFSVCTVPMGVAWWRIFTKAGHLRPRDDGSLFEVFSFAVVRVCGLADSERPDA